MLKKIIFASAIAGLVAGLFISALQSVRTIPLILQAETYETAASAVSHTHTETGVTHAHINGGVPHTHSGSSAMLTLEPAGEAPGDFSRTALSAVSNIVTAIGFALLLIAGFAVKGGVDWRKGILWGLGGFAAFSLAPSIGLPPELPGTFAAALPDRQAWWTLTVALTAGGLALAAFAPGWVFKALGAALVIVPHLIGAPQPELHGGLAPEALMQQFVVAALITSGLFWMVLGGVSGYLFGRFEKA